MITKKQNIRRASKMSIRTLELREQLWPDLDKTLLWDRTIAKGFTTLPRTMPHILEIMDDLAGKGTPVAKVYLSLWCRVFDEALIELKSYSDLAYEAGFSGQRAVTLWKKRMASLVDLGFIMAEKGSADEAMLEISKLIAPFWKIEGFAMKLEPIFSMKDALKVIGKSL